MSEPLVAAALVGTARAGQDALFSGTPVDTLVAALGEMAPERVFLLRAGALGIYREAGLVPEHISEPLPTPAPPEDRPICHPHAMTLLPIILRHHKALYPEFLDRLDRARLIVPPEFLPEMFSTRPELESRTAIRRVIGARGRWLASFHPAWKWALEEDVAQTTTSEEQERIWQEGTPGQRLAVLAHVRAEDPAQARDWIAATWKQEKADMRADLLPILATHLSDDDEALLERALDDKVLRVRSAAAANLARLSHSALVQRMTARGDAMLERTPSGALIAHIPDAKVFNATWERDGLVREAPRGTSQGDWWLEQLLRNIPLEHWEARFGLAPAMLVETALGSERALALINGWAHAAAQLGNEHWLVAIWETLLARNIPLSQQLCDLLLPHLPTTMAEDAAIRFMRHPTPDTYSTWQKIVSNLPYPWSDHFGAIYLAALQEQSATESTFRDYWPATFQAAARGLPPACFADLPPDLVPAGMSEGVIKQWQRNWGELVAVIGLRQRIINEIPLT